MSDQSSNPLRLGWQSEPGAPCHVDASPESTTLVVRVRNMDDASPLRVDEVDAQLEPLGEQQAPAAASTKDTDTSGDVRLTFEGIVTGWYQVLVTRTDVASGRVTATGTARVQVIKLLTKARQDVAQEV